MSVPDLSLTEQVAQHLDGFDSAPFLFVGSGLSRRYLGTEDWAGLLRRFSALTDRPWEYYLSTANGDYPEAASNIAERFHEVWWSSPRFVQSRKLFQKEARDRQSPLKFEIANYLRGISPLALPEDLGPSGFSEELLTLSQVMVDGVITTNWNQMLEQIFPDYQVFIGQEELLFARLLGIAEIYKIHGCCTQPNSLVLTAEDYSRFSLRNPYLASKLLTVFVEHPVVFLGYSLTDKNIRAILASIVECLSKEHIDQLKERLIFVEWDSERRGASFEQTTLPVSPGVNVPLMVIRTYSFQPVYEALATLRRKFPAATLRSLKDHVYTLVQTNDPTEKMHVLGIEEADVSSSVDVVFGVGIQSKLGHTGYKAISSDEVYRDLIFGEGASWDPAQVVEHVLPRLLSKTRTNLVPVYKYLRNAGQIDEAGNLVGEVHPRVRAAFSDDFERLLPSGSYRGEGKWVHSVAENLEELWEVCESIWPDKVPWHFFVHATHLGPDRLEQEKTLGYLRQWKALLVSDDISSRTAYKKLACAYDWLTYRNP